MKSTVFVVTEQPAGDTTCDEEKLRQAVEIWLTNELERTPTA